MLLFKKYRCHPLCSLDSSLKNAKMLRHTPNSELLFPLIEKGSEAKNWAQCLPRGFIATLQAGCKEILRDMANPPKSNGSQTTWLPGEWGEKTGIQALPTRGAKVRDGKQASKRLRKSPFLKSFIVNIIANLSLCTFQARSWSSCS